MRKAYLFANRLVKVELSFVVERFAESLNVAHEFGFFVHVIGPEAVERSGDHPISFNEGPNEEAEELEHVVGVNFFIEADELIACTW